MAERRDRNGKRGGGGKRPRAVLENAYAGAEATRPTQRRKRARKTREMSSSMRLLSAVLTLMFLGFSGLAAGIVWFDQSSRAPGPTAQARVFSVQSGDGTRTIAERLRHAGFVNSERLFVARYMSRAAMQRFEGDKRLLLKAGRYELPAGASIDDIINILARGRSIPSFLTFPEGWTTNAILRRLERETRLVGEIEEPPAEGSLLPATFDIRKGMSRADVIERMREAQERVLAELWAARAPDLPVKTPEEAVILASIVQREMGPDDDPKRIASVFINRLRKGMRLESDPTILYGIYGRDVDWSKPILRSQIRKPTAHNTYTIKGLPPTPICNPGRAALEAVLNPAETDDLYFVANGRGGHFFASTLSGHNANVVKWRKIEREIRARERAEKAAAVAKAARAGQDGQIPNPQAASDAKVEPTTVRPKRVSTIKIVNNGETGEGPVPLPSRKPSQRR